jgi:hypothetical protein
MEEVLVRNDSYSTHGVQSGGLVRDKLNGPNAKER